MNQDPIGLAGGVNSYLYSDISPTNVVDPKGLKTVQCTKPLHALGDKWGSLGYKYGPYLYHQYSCVVGNDGKVVCGGQDRNMDANGKPTGKGKPSVDIIDPPGGNCKDALGDNACFETCLIKEWGKPRPDYGIPIGTDCQEYDAAVNDKCKKQCNVKENLGGINSENS